MASTRSPWLVLVAMTGSLSMIMLDQTVVTVALPTMSRELPLTAAGQPWVVNAYILAMAATVALGGRLGDRLGGATMFRVGVAIFFLASAACGLAPAGPWGQPSLIVARAVQGVGAALMTPVSAALVMGAFDVSRRGRAMAVYAGISQVFLAVGPVLGGFLTQHATWRMVFWLNIPVGVAALILVRIARPDNATQPTARVPAGSVVLLVTGIGATVLAVQQAHQWSWTSPLTIVTLAAGVLLTTAFVLRQLHTADPLVNVRLFTVRGYRADTVIAGLMQFGLLAVVLYSSLYLQDLLEMSPVAAGSGVLPLIAALAVAAQFGGRWYDRSGVRPPVLTGLVLATAGLLAWAVSLPLLAYPPQVPGMILTGLGLGLIISPTNTDALGQVPDADRSQASGLLQTVRQLGGTFGVALIGAVVLGLENEGTRANSVEHAAYAITVGFACAAGVFGFALLLGWRLLPRERLTTTVTTDRPHHRVTERVTERVTDRQTTKGAQS